MKRRYSIWLDDKLKAKLERVAESKGLKTAQLIRLYLTAGLKREKG